MERLHSADVQPSKDVGAGIHPPPVPAAVEESGETSRLLASSAFCSAYLSDMATCSSIDEPVLVFQFPEMDVLLDRRTFYRLT